MLFSEILAGNARRVAADRAWRFMDRSWSWGEANARVNRLADALTKRGLCFQDRVILLGNNSNHYLELLFAASKLGLVAVPMTPKSVLRDVGYVAGDVDAKAIFLSPDLARSLGDLGGLGDRFQLIAGWGPGHGLAEDCDALVESGSDIEPPSNFSDETIRTVKFTSGTTGEPKGCIGTHRSMIFSVLSYLAQTPVIQPGSIGMVPLSLSTGFGLNTFAALAYRNAETVIMERFLPGAALDLIATERVERSCGVPTMIGAMAEEQAQRPRDLSSLKVFGYSGSPASIALIRRARELLGCDFYQGYGSTESGGRVTFLSIDDHRAVATRDEGMTDAWGRAVISCGREAPGFQIRLVDDAQKDVAQGEVGELMVRGASIFGGYWNRPEKTKETIRDGWLLTGDMARCDADGFFYVVDRKRDMIVSGGYNVYSVEVESVLMEHPAVGEAAVVGLPDRQWGEAVNAFVILKPGAATTPEELAAHCKANLSAFKVPKTVRILADLPRTSVGKVRKTDLRAAYANAGQAAGEQA